MVQPLWEAVGGVKATILCLRHPMTVAGSLYSTHQVGLERALFLWFRYSAAAIINSPDALIVEHETFLLEPDRQLNRVVDYIGLETSSKILGATAQSISGHVVGDETPSLPEGPIGAMCSRLYEVLQSGRPLEDDEPVFLWARLATELPWGGPGEIDVRRARREVVEQGINVARLARENQRNEDRLQRLTDELQRTLRTMDRMSFADIAGNLNDSEAHVSNE
jgi:hypothetical protein